MKNKQTHCSSQVFGKLWALSQTLSNGFCSCRGKIRTYVCILSGSHSMWGLQGRSVWWSLGCGNPSYIWRIQCFQPKEKNNRAADEGQHPTSAHMAEHHTQNRQLAETWRWWWQGVKEEGTRSDNQHACLFRSTESVWAWWQMPAIQEVEIWGFQVQGQPGLYIVSSRLAWAVSWNPVSNKCRHLHFRSPPPPFTPIGLFSLPLLPVSETPQTAPGGGGNCFHWRLWRLTTCRALLGPITPQCVKIGEPCRLPEHLSHLTPSLAPHLSVSLHPGALLFSGLVLSQSHWPFSAIAPSIFFLLFPPDQRRFLESQVSFRQWPMVVLWVHPACITPTLET